MKTLIVRTLLLLGVLLIGSAIFAVSRPHSFGARPSLTPLPVAIPGSYFGMTVHKYGTTTPWPSIPFASLRTWDTLVTWPDNNHRPQTPMIGLAWMH